MLLDRYVLGKETPRVLKILQCFSICHIKNSEHAALSKIVNIAQFLPTATGKCFYGYWTATGHCLNSLGKLLGNVQRLRVASGQFSEGIR